MNITITTANGFGTNARLPAKVGMKVKNCEIVKVNAKSILISSERHSEPEKLEQLSRPYFTLSDEEVSTLTTHNGDTFEATDIDEAARTLFKMGSYDAMNIMGAFAEKFLENVDLKKEKIVDQYSAGSLAENTVWTVVNQLVNK
jgi:CRISPR/Cas system Type II protein with McrA/HNH and RuvC-like nuclease domain